MARKHTSMYRVRAQRHEEAARNSKGYKKEGHLEIAEGYHKLAAHRGEPRHVKSRKGKSRKGRKRGRGGRFR
jgi:hypothetical protein